jgi:hypothetical protein
MRLTPRQQAAKDRYIRRKYAKDMIQPSNPLFKRYYPKQAEDMEKAEYDLEQKKKQDKKNKEEYFNKWRNTQHRHSMRNALKLEEKLDEQK